MRIYNFQRGVEIMKIFRGIINSILIIIIVSGVGFLAWNIMNNSGNLHGMNMGSNQNNTDNTGSPQAQQHTGNNATQGMQNNSSINTMDIQNKDKLNQVITTINDAVNQITIDPYSKVTVPRSGIQQNAADQQGNTTINIYPNGNNAANAPAQGNTQPQAAANNQNANTVYSQGQLAQLHNGIFKLSQGLMLLNELNDDLNIQVTNQEQENYEGYVSKYNTLYQNKTKLTNVLNLINEGSLFMNINPYASGGSYQYDTGQMEQLNKGIYKLAQGMFMGVRLGEDFTNQMAQVSNLANNASMSNMNMAPSYSIGNIDVKVILYILIIVFVLTFIIAVLGAVRAAFKPAK